MRARGRVNKTGVHLQVAEAFKCISQLYWAATTPRQPGMAKGRAQRANKESKQRLGLENAANKRTLTSSAQQRPACPTSYLSANDSTADALSWHQPHSPASPAFQRGRVASRRATFTHASYSLAHFIAYSVPPTHVYLYRAHQVASVISRRIASSTLLVLRLRPVGGILLRRPLPLVRLSQPFLFLAELFVGGRVRV